MEQTAPTKRPPRRQTRMGVVRSDVRDKTIRVETQRLVSHAKYGKYLRRRTVIQAHDERNEARAGDTVEIVSCRPLSRTKSWRLVRIVQREAGALPAGEGA
jgi:small subunit ribosomal protein S17